MEAFTKGPLHIVVLSSHPELQMRLKDPFSLKAAEMTKRTNKPRKPRDEESSDEVSGKQLKCLHRERIRYSKICERHIYGILRMIDVYLLCIVIFTGLTCQHVSKAVDLNSVKKIVLSSVWFVCSDCLKERTIIDSEPGASNDIVVCLKCGFQVIVLMLTHI